LGDVMMRVCIFGCGHRANPTRQFFDSRFY